MCWLCEENRDDYVSCPDCGCWICFDVQEDGDDVLRPACVTEAGDLACSRCGRRADRDYEEAAAALDFDWFGDGWPVAP